MLNLRSLLDSPQIYQAFQVAGGFFGARLVSMQRYLQLTGNEKIVDIGCGPGYLKKHLPQSCMYFGYDTDSNYIDFARRNQDAQSEYHLGIFGRSEAAAVAPVDLVLMAGLLHHLTDDEARELTSLAWAILNPGGRLYSLDGCYVPNQSSFNRKLLDWDRGQYVRDAAGYAALFPSDADLEQHIDSDISRIPYTFLTCVARKQT